MKSIKGIQDQIRKNYDRRKEVEADIERLSLAEERRSAASANNYDLYKALYAEKENNEEAINVLCDELKDLNLAAPVLKENLKAAIVAAGIEALKEVIAPYDGKQYGEKTADKIREAMWAKGFSFYFRNYVSWDASKNKIEINTYDGRYHGSSENATIYAANEEVFIDAENRINVAALENAHSGYKYIENVNKQVKAIKKAIEAHRKASEAAYKTQGALNELLSWDTNHVNNIQYGKFQVCGMYF